MMTISEVVSYFAHYWAILLLLIGAGTANAIMDTIQFHFGISIFKSRSNWWNNKTSWENKWKLDAEGKPIVGKPRFFGSSTFLVFVTDAWHFFQFIMFTLFTIAILAYKPYATEWYFFIVDFIAFKLTFSAAFMVNWKWILVKK
jgi:hypothetical protein